MGSWENCQVLSQGLIISKLITRAYWGAPETWVDGLDHNSKKNFSSR